MLPIAYPQGFEPDRFPVPVPPDPLVFLNFVWNGVEVLIRAMFGG